MLLTAHMSYEDDKSLSLGQPRLPGPFLAAALVSLAITVVIAAAFGIVFETVDDYNIMMSLSGEKTGSPYWELTFYNAVFSFIQSRLYSIIPGVQWYSIIELGLIFTAHTVFLGIILERCRKVGISWILALPTYLLLFCAAFFYPMQRMQFTTTSALLGMASCATMYSIDARTIDTRALLRRLMLSGILLLLSLLERQSSGLCALIFWVSGIVRIGIFSGMGLFPNVRNSIRAMIIVIIATLGLCGAFTAGHELVNRVGDNASYTAYDEWRVRYQDYPRPDYDEAVNVYARAGWSREIYSIATSLTYIAPEINEQAFKSIVQSAEMEAASPSVLEALQIDVNLVITNKAARSLFCALLAIYVSICGIFVQHRSPGGGFGKYGAVLFAGATGTVLLAITASLGVCLSGRWPLRSFQAIGLPLMACLVMIMLEMIPLCTLICSLDGSASSRVQQSPLNCLSSKASILYAAFFVLVTIGALFGIEATREAHERDGASIAQMASIEEYAINHPEDLFVHDYSVSNIWNAYDPFRIYKHDLSNLIISGGSYTYSGCYFAQLRANRMTRLTGAELLDDHVFYVSDEDHPDFLRRTLEYMRSVYGDVAVEECASLYGGVKVYKFKL